MKSLKNIRVVVIQSNNVAGKRKLYDLIKQISDKVILILYKPESFNEQTDINQDDEYIIVYKEKKSNDEKILV